MVAEWQSWVSHAITIFLYAKYIVNWVPTLKILGKNYHLLFYREKSWDSNKQQQQKNSVSQCHRTSKPGFECWGGILPFKVAKQQKDPAFPRRWEAVAVFCTIILGQAFGQKWEWAWTVEMGTAWCPSRWLPSGSRALASSPSIFMPWPIFVHPLNSLAYFFAEELFYNLRWVSVTCWA